MAEIRNRITLDGADTVRASLDALARAAEAFAERMNALRSDGLEQTRQRADGARTSLLNVQNQAVATGATLNGAFQNASANVTKTTNSLGGLVARLVEVGGKAVLAVGAIGAATFAATQALSKSAAESAEQIGDNADKVGLSVKAYQELIFASGKVRVATDDVNKGFGTLSDNIDAVLEGANKFGTFAGNPGIDRFNSGVGVLNFSKDDKTVEQAARERDLSNAVQNATERLADLERQQGLAADGSGRAAIAQDRYNARLRDAKQVLTEAQQRQADFNTTQSRPQDSGLQAEIDKRRLLTNVFKELRIPLTAFTQALSDNADEEDADGEEAAQNTLKQRDKAAIMQDVIDRLRQIPEGAKKARLENILFGDSAKALQPLLALTSEELQKYREELGATGRALTADDVGNARAFTAAQKDLSLALKATKDQIGLLFLPGKTAAAQFFTGIVDSLRPVIVGFVAAGIAEAKLFAGDAGNRQKFIDGLKFVGNVLLDIAKIIIAAVKPAIDLLDAAFTSVAKAFKDITGEDISKEFLTALSAVLALARGFSLLSISTDLVVGSLTLVAGLISGLGPLSIVAAAGVALFWEDFSKAGGEALSVVTKHADEFKDALAKALKGDFSGSFAAFKQAVSGTFADLLKDVPLLGRAVNAVKNTFIELKNSVTGAFETLRVTLQGAALVINVLFGTSFTDKSLAATLAVLQFTGTLTSLAAISVAVASGVRILGTSLSLVILGLATLGRLGLFEVFGRLKDAIAAAFTGGDIKKALAALQKAFDDFWTHLEESSLHTWAVIGAAGVAAFFLLRSVAVSTGFSLVGAFSGLFGIALTVDLLRRGLLTIATAAVLVADSIRRIFSGEIKAGLLELGETAKFIGNSLISADGGTWAEIAIAAALTFGRIVALAKLTGTAIKAALGLGAAGAAAAGTGAGTAGGAAAAGEATVAGETALAGVAGGASAAGAKAGIAFRLAFLGEISLLGTLAVAILSGFDKKVQDELRSAIDDFQEAQKSAEQKAAEFADKQKAASDAADAEAKQARQQADNPALFGPRLNEDPIKSVLTDLSDRAGAAFNDLTSRTAAFGTSAQASVSKAREAVASVEAAGKKAAEVLPRVFDQNTVSTFAEATKAAGEALPKVFDQTNIEKFKLGLSETKDAAKAAAEESKGFFGTLLDLLEKGGQAGEKAATEIKGSFKRITLPASPVDNSGGSDLTGTAGGAGESSTLPTNAAQDQIQPLSQALDDLIAKVSGELTAAFAAAVDPLAAGLAKVDSTLDALIAKAQQLAQALAAPPATDTTTKLLEIPNSDLSAGSPQPAPKPGTFSTDALRPSSNVEDRRPGFQDQATAFQEAWSAAVAFVNDLFTRTFGEEIPSLFGELVGEAQTAAAGLTAAIGGALDGLIQKTQQLVQALASVQPANDNSTPPPSASAPGGFASGGPVKGPGGPRSDSILARLSAGEHVINAQAVHHYGGHALFSALNSMTVPARQVADAVRVTVPSMRETLHLLARQNSTVDRSASTIKLMIREIVERQILRPLGFASGGAVRGPGTSTSDSIPARLSVGEHVIKASAVQHYGGHRFFAALNAMAIPAQSVMAALRHSLPALGRSLAVSIPAIPAMLGAGLATTMPVQHFAEGGPVLPAAAPVTGAGPSLHPVIFDLGGGSRIAARMSPDEFDAAHKTFLVRKTLRQA